jgi:hypothetical protein
MVYGMDNPEYAKYPQLPSYPRKRVSRLIWAKTNLDSRVRGKDESRGKGAEGNLPFLFSVGARKIMNHFVVKDLLVLSDDEGKTVSLGVGDRQRPAANS